MAKQPQVATRPNPYRLCERVWEVWYGHGRPGDNGTCLGVVAALTLLVNPLDWERGQGKPELVEAAEQLILSSSDDEITGLLKHAWQMFWILRPELCMRCGPLADWLNADEPDKQTVKAAAAVAREVVRLGLFRVGWDDILGQVYTEGNSKSAASARGEYYTPHSLCHMMAKVMIGRPNRFRKGHKFMEPAVGTGGMFLGAVHALIEDGADPANYWWVGNDIAVLPVALCAVNVHCWGMGPNVILGVANSLSEPDWPERAWKEQQAAKDQRDAQVQAARMLAILEYGEAAVPLVVDENPWDPGDRALQPPLFGDDEEVA